MVQKPQFYDNHSVPHFHGQIASAFSSPAHANPVHHAPWSRRSSPSPSNPHTRRQGQQEERCNAPRRQPTDTTSSAKNPAPPHQKDDPFPLSGSNRAIVLRAAPRDCVLAPRIEYERTTRRLNRHHHGLVPSLPFAPERSKGKEASLLDQCWFIKLHALLLWCFVGAEGGRWCRSRGTGSSWISSGLQLPPPVSCSVSSCSWWHVCMYDPVFWYLVYLVRI
jgi:hypothetical protein